MATTYYPVFDPHGDAVVNGSSELGTSENFYFVPDGSASATFTVNRGDTGGHLWLYDDSDSLLKEEHNYGSGSVSLNYSVTAGYRYRLKFDEKYNITGSYTATLNLPSAALYNLTSRLGVNGDVTTDIYGISPRNDGDYWHYVAPASGTLDITADDVDNAIGFDTDLFAYAWSFTQNKWQLGWQDTGGADDGNLTISGLFKGAKICFLVRGDVGDDDTGRYKLIVEGPAKPYTPGIIYPHLGQTGVPRTPTFDCAGFGDPDSGDTHLETQWQLSNNSTYTDIFWDYIDRDSDKTSEPLHGTLNYGRRYYLRVRYADNHANWSNWTSDAVAWDFTTVERPTGSLNVTIEPQGARNAGAQWRVDSGTWHNSGYTQSGLSVGQHTVEFKSISGWSTPGSQNVQINANETTYTSGTYTEQTGSLNVTIQPEGARNAGAQWRVDGGSWHNSGYTQSGLSVGQHTVEFKSISGWSTPGSQNVQINANETTYTSGTYTEQTGSLNVTIQPEGARNAGAQWRVDGGSWHNSGYTQSGLSVGQHTVEFKSISGWYKPGDQSIQIDADQATYASGTYTAGIIGDFCGADDDPPDGYVDVWDLMQFADHWHTRTGEGNWDAKFDLTGPDFGDIDGYVDVWDLMIFADNWHKGQKP